MACLLYTQHAAPPERAPGPTFHHRRPRYLRRVFCPTLPRFVRFPLYNGTRLQSHVVLIRCVYLDTWDQQHGGCFWQHLLLYDVGTSHLGTPTPPVARVRYTCSRVLRTIYEWNAAITNRTFVRPCTSARCGTPAPNVRGALGILLCRHRAARCNLTAPASAPPNCMILCLLLSPTRAAVTAPHSTISPSYHLW